MTPHIEETPGQRRQELRIRLQPDLLEQVRTWAKAIGQPMGTAAATLVGEALLHRRVRTIMKPGHDFVPIENHPDDDECAHRSDSTDATYCGAPRAAVQDTGDA